MLDIPVTITGHLFQTWDYLGRENAWVKLRLALFQNLSNCEPHIGYGIFHSFLESWDDQRTHLILAQKWYDLLQRLQTTHSVVVALFVGVINFIDFRDKGTNYPFTLELVS